MVEHYCPPGWAKGTSQDCEKEEHSVKLGRTKRPEIHDGREKK
jgi:hypothetical protein